MNENNLNNQMIEAKENINYFFAKVIISVLLALLQLAVVVSIGLVINHILVIASVLIYTIYLFYDTIKKINYYFDFILDINNTIKNIDSSISVDFKKVNSFVLNIATK